MRPRPASLAAIVLAAAALAACGGDDETTTSTTTTATSATGAADSAGADAADAEAKASVRTTQTALEVYFTENASYAGADATALAEIEPSVPDDIEVEGEDESYSLTLPSESGNSFTIERVKSGKVTFTCTEPGAGGCDENGEW